MKIHLIIAAVLGFLGVAIGAFGAHGLKKILETVGKVDQFETANKYHWYHTFAIFVASWCFYQTQNQQFSLSSWFFIVGILIFSGSLYAYSLTGIKVFAMVTPIGGLAFLVAWTLLLLGVVKSF